MKLDPVHLELFVTSLAKRKAKAAVEAQILAEGKKVAHFSLRELYDKREAYFQSHCEELIALALVDVWRLPSFARYRNQTTQT